MKMKIMLGDSLPRLKRRGGGVRTQRKMMTLMSLLGLECPKLKIRVRGRILRTTK